MVVHIVLGLMWKMMCLKFFHSKVSQNLTSFLSSRLHEDAISFFTFLLLSEIPLPFKQPPFLTYWQTNTAHSEPLFSANVSHSRLKHSISSPLWCHFCTFPPDNPALQPSSFLFPSFILFWATSSPVKAHDESSYNYPLYSQEHLNRSLFFFFLKNWPIVSVRGWSGTRLTQSPTENPENWPFPISWFPQFPPISPGS